MCYFNAINNINNRMSSSSSSDSRYLRFLEDYIKDERERGWEENNYAQLNHLAAWISSTQRGSGVGVADLFSAYVRLEKEGKVKRVSHDSQRQSESRWRTIDDTKGKGKGKAPAHSDSDAEDSIDYDMRPFMDQLRCAEECFRRSEEFARKLQQEELMIGIKNATNVDYPPIRGVALKGYKRTDGCVIFEEPVEDEEEPAEVEKTKRGRLDDRDLLLESVDTQLNMLQESNCEIESGLKRVQEGLAAIHSRLGMPTKPANTLLVDINSLEFSRTFSNHAVWLPLRLSAAKDLRIVFYSTSGGTMVLKRVLGELEMEEAFENTKFHIEVRDYSRLVSQSYICDPDPLFAFLLGSLCTDAQRNKLPQSQAHIRVVCDNFETVMLSQGGGLLQDMALQDGVVISKYVSAPLPAALRMPLQTLYSQ